MERPTDADDQAMRLCPEGESMTKGCDLAKPRLGFLGLGWIGLQRMAAIVSSGAAEIVALADPVTDLVAKAAELAPQAARMQTLDQLLENEVQGVVIATPSALHASQT